ncbi:MAG: alpha/beta hydrolase [Spirochaetales bacterium]|nr:MAG: alpha/beta hydrolase [Spirochaetales bacterium]
MPLSLRSRFYKALLRRIIKNRNLSLEQIRAGAGMVAMPTSILPKGVSIMRDTIGGVPVDRVALADAEPGRIVMHLHGGGYVSGSPDTHRMLTSLLARTTRATVLVPDYRLAPEKPFPAAMDDTLAVYRSLLADGYEARNIAISGDSAGGGLALATVILLRESRESLPAALVCMSPWTDLMLEGASYTANAASDAVLNVTSLREWAAFYAAGESLDNPLLSPARGEFDGFPPLLIQVCGDEMLLDDALVVARKAEAAGVSVTLDIKNGLWHCWQLMGNLVPENRETFAETGAFLRAHLGIGSVPGPRTGRLGQVS